MRLVLDFLRHKPSSGRIDDVNLLAGQAQHTFIEPLAIGWLLANLRDALDVLSRCRAAKDEWFRHNCIMGRQLPIRFVLNQLVQVATVGRVVLLRPWGRSLAAPWPLLAAWK
jgi:hypothetical protein